MAMLGRTIVATMGSVAAFVLTTATASAAPVPGTDADFITVTTTATTATITTKPKPLNACSTSIVLPGTPADAAGPPAWSATSTEMQSIDPALADTLRFRPVAKDYPELFTTRTKTITLAAGSYVAVAGCTPYDSDGNFAGKDTTHYKAFKVTGTSNPNPGGPSGSAWGSLGSLFG